MVSISKIKIIYLLSFIFLLSVLHLSSFAFSGDGRKIEIKGRVSDGAGKPIEDAIIIVDNQITGCRTDSLGRFQLKVKRGAEKIEVFTFDVGIKEEAIGGRTDIDINFSAVPKLSFSGRKGDAGLMGRNDPDGETSVDLGYARIKKKYLTGDIDVIDGTKKKYASYSSVLEMIQREVSGVRIVGNSVIIQASGNMFGSIPALVVIDGTYGGSLDDVSPSSVESIAVLKGSSAAIFGSRGYGGAILVTTRKY